MELHLGMASSFFLPGDMGCSLYHCSPFHVRDSRSHDQKLKNFSPESPRWLVAQGYIEDAHTVLARVNARGDKENPIVVSEFARIVDALQTDRAVAANAMSPKELFRTPVARRRLAIGASPGLFSCIAGNIIASYYISTFLTGAGITDPQDQLKAVGHSGLSELMASRMLYSTPGALYAASAEHSWLSVGAGSRLP